MGARHLTRLIAPTTLAVCLILGGHSTQTPIASAICLLLSLAVISYHLIASQGQPIRWTSAPLLIILAAAALPLLQLVPLPPAVWMSLPGRELTIDTLRAAGVPLTIHLPLTLDSLATLSAALHVLPTLAMFLAVSQLRTNERELLLQTIIAVALASFVTLIPHVQHLVNSASGTVGTDFSGFFANRNHQADLLLIATMCVACLHVMRQRRGAVEASVSLLIAGALLIGALATLSRMAFALVPLVIASSLLMVWRSAGHHRRASVVVGGVSLILLVGWGGALYILPHVIDRLHLPQDLRFREWPDIVWAIHQYLPWGSGMGTFDQVFRSAEQLSGLSIEYMNEAHNEYLQVLLEGGLPGALLIAAALIWYAYASFTSWCARDPLGELASTAILIYALHSLVDYPLRTISHGALLGTFAAVLQVQLFARRHRKSQAAQDSEMSSKSSSAAPMDCPA